MKTTPSLFVALLALVAVLAGPAAAHFEIAPPMAGFTVYLAGALLGLIAVIWGVIAKGRGTSRGGALAVLLGGLPFLAAAIPTVVSLTRGHPRINDITTDTEDPPAFIESTVHGDYPVGFAEKAQKAYPEVKTLRLSIPPQQALEKAVELAKDSGAEIVATTETSFEAYQRTTLFRFRDDFVVRVRPADGGSEIDMRSASRDGQGDFGVNAARIESFLAALK